MAERSHRVASCLKEAQEIRESIEKLCVIQETADMKSFGGDSESSCDELSSEDDAVNLHDVQDVLCTIPTESDIIATLKNSHSN